MTFHAGDISTPYGPAISNACGADGEQHSRSCLRRGRAAAQRHAGPHMASRGAPRPADFAPASRRRWDHGRLRRAHARRRSLASGAARDLAAAFSVIKWCGAAFAVRRSRLIRELARAACAPARPLPPASPSRIFREAFVINVFNPKSRCSSLAFLPLASVPRRRRSARVRRAGCLFNFGSLFVCSGRVLPDAGSRIRAHRSAARLVDRHRRCSCWLAARPRDARA